MTPRHTLRALLVASAILLFVDLGGSSIWDANEAFYVETPRQMVLTGDYVTPVFNGVERLNKPVLSYWVVAGFYKVLGVSVTTERIAIALGTLMLIAATFVIGRTVGNTDTGVVAALIIASAPRVMLWSRRIFIDIYLASFLAVALMGLVLARANPQRRRRYLIVMYAGLGLAMLTKGPVALVLPGLVLCVFLLWVRQFSELKKMMVPVGLLIIAGIVVPWYAMLYHQHGWQPIRDFFIGENLDRYRETYGVQHRTAWFYLPVLLTDLSPWALFLPAGLWAAWRTKDSQMRLLMVWIAAFVGVLTFSSTKQDLYIFPIVPAVAVIVASLVVRQSEGLDDLKGIRTLMRVGGGVTAAMLIVVGGGFVWLAGVAHLIPDITQLAVVGVVLALGGMAAAVCVARARLWPMVIALAVTAVVANWLLVTTVMRPFERFKPVPPISAWLNAHAPAATVVAHYKSPLPSLTYYLGRPITGVFDLPTMTRLVDQQPALYVVLQPHEFDELSHATLAPLCILDKRSVPLFDAKLSEILSKTVPQIWLVGIKAACQ